jgi:hypothetical protein
VIAQPIIGNSRVNRCLIASRRRAVKRCSKLNEKLMDRATGSVDFFG